MVDRLHMSEELTIIWRKQEAIIQNARWIKGHLIHPHQHHHRRTWIRCDFEQAIQINKEI